MPNALPTPANNETLFTNTGTNVATPQFVVVPTGEGDKDHATLDAAAVEGDAASGGEGRGWSAKVLRERLMQGCGVEFEQGLPPTFDEGTPSQHPPYLTHDVY
jgi:hypothetical protein